MASYKLSQDADIDLLRLYQYGAENFGLALAERYYGGLIRQLELLAENPYLGQAVGYIRIDYRRCVYQQHSIYYQIKDEHVFIVRILGRESTDIFN